MPPRNPAPSSVTPPVLRVLRVAEVAPEEANRLWAAEPGETNWPALPRSTVVRLRAESVEIEGEHNREMGEVRDRSDPRERIRQRLDRFRERLKQRCTFLEGLEFADDSATDGPGDEDDRSEPKDPKRPVSKG
jgi:hypothetical protein